MFHVSFRIILSFVFIHCDERAYRVDSTVRIRFGTVAKQIINYGALM